jgi:sortase A
MSERVHVSIVAALLVISSFFFGKAGWIHAKAQLAYFLIDSAWARTCDGKGNVKPWGWADTWPVARLRAPRLKVNQVILSGATGRTLAFAPGHHAGSARPGTAGNTVIAGHRDTHFAFLKQLQPGDLLTLETSDGCLHPYRIATIGVYHQDRTELLQPTAERVLTLVTCYPFDAIVPGGPLRYVVRAVGVKDDEAKEPILSDLK